MSRVKGGTVTHARHKKIVKQAKGYYGRRKNTFKVAAQAVDKANQYATRDRHNRKRNFRALWIQRINAAVRSHDVSTVCNPNRSCALKKPWSAPCAQPWPKAMPRPAIRW